jgi:hypothetical protein
MIAEILIIIGLVLINLIILFIIKWDQEDMWEDITEIKRIVNDQSHYLRAIDKKIEDKIKPKQR